MKWIVMMLVCWGVVTCGERRVRAAEDAGLNAALKSAPNGIPLTDLYKLDQVANATTGQLNGPRVDQSVAQLTSSAGTGTQISALWSKANENGGAITNQVNLTRNALWGFWLYFGDKGAATSEGMAFVLQNAERRMVPIPKTDAGQTIGVWGGAPSDGRNVNPASVARQGISSSWALEFDTHVNNDEGHELNNFLDYKASKGPHIASGYPGDSSSYKIVNKSGQGHPTLHHNQLQYLKSNPADGRWRHVTLNWEAKTRQMTYAFNDRDPETNLAIRPEATDNMTVETSFLVPPKKTGAVQEAAQRATSATWGITSASTTSDNQMVVVDQDPRWPKMRTTSLVELLGQNEQKVNDGDVLKGLSAQDRIRFTSKIDFANEGILVGGVGNNGPFTANIGLPRPAIVKGITVQNGENTILETTDDTAEGILGDRFIRVLERKVSRRILTAMTEATFPATNQSVEVKTPPSLFYGSTYFISVPTTSFRIEKLLDLKLTSLDDLPLTTSKDVTLKGLLRNGSQPIDLIDRDNSRVALTLNGQNQGKNVLGFKWLTKGEVGNFQMTVPKRLLQVGKNEVTVKVTDQQGHVSNDLKIPINLRTGELSFTDVPSDGAFMPQRLTGKTQTISRQPGPGWKLGVRDTRGVGRRWQLQINMAEQFHDSSGRRLQGKLIYVIKNVSYVIGDHPTTVLRRETTKENEVTEISKDEWTEKSGLLLVVDKDAVASDYQGKIHWQLTDVP
ncbi:lectin-like domain-containing protein [Levilactobacillus fujinensis]|uniref:WxL domain-containing protein n=1 Tax=Levilactobacillus fujinensis TaxID=2486024 RepID=A0ABW1TDN8_9LACO|nr:hypothetical protein [Levilactobacillus fujinensis]